MRRLFLFLFLLLLLAVMPARPADDAPLAPAETIELATVRGRIDHLAFDSGGKRLFVAALGNDSVEVVDAAAGRRLRSMHGFAEPQGVQYVAESDRLFIASSRGARIDIRDGKSLARISTVEGLGDADNIRYDAAARRVYVGHSEGAIRVLDAQTGASMGDIALAGHPESFQLEVNGPRIFVNVPSARHVAVVDRAKGAVVATWEVAEARANFPMALDEAGRRLFVGTRLPALLLVYDIDTGKVVARLEIGGDTDDLFFDAARKRLYVICGEGRIDIIRQQDRDHYSLESTVSTAPRARTGLFVPENQRLYVAAPATGTAPARVLAYRIR
jgi:DNA-binding beta-propeller fold protein YncE